MATFQAQVEGLTGLSIGTSPTTGELTEFLKDGGYVEHDVVYQWDDTLNQYVAIKKS